MSEPNAILGAKKRMCDEGLEGAWNVQREAMVADGLTQAEAATAAEDVLAEFEFPEVAGAEELRWIYENLDRAGLDIRQAPSGMAFSAVMTARKSPKLKEAILMAGINQKLRKVEKSTQYERMEDNGQSIIDLCDTLLGANVPEEEAA